MKSPRATYLILILLVFATFEAAFSQKEANHWFFGSYCGMNFNTANNAPIFEDGSQMATDEGCASISDVWGELLFYTDGKSVWNREHVQMPNGHDLNGHESSTQSAVITAKPGSFEEYYIFTVDRQGGTYGLSYSTVDMNRDNGLGDIVSKNNYLHFPVAEKITAIRHKNGRDIWIITHEWGSDKFLSYLLTNAGMIEIPVVSSVGSAYDGDNMNAVGYMKASPDGMFIATTVYWEGIFEILRFDNESGRISSPISFKSPDFHTVYGVEFSADVSKVYFTKSRENSTIFQVDLKAGNDLAIFNSLTVVAESYSDYVYQALQIAPDKKIYVAKRNKTYLSVIESPNEKGNACGFIENGFNLEGRKCNAGLPTFNQSFLDIYVAILGKTDLCEGDNLVLKCSEYDGATYQWEGPDNFSSSNSNVEINNVTLNQAGYYKVTIEVNGELVSDSVFVNIFENPNALIQQGDTAYICNNQILELTSVSEGNNLSLLWSTGEKTNKISVTEPGEYYLLAINENDCVDTAYILILPRELPDVKIVTISGYPKLCAGEEIVLSTKDSYISYNWSTGSTEASISISDAGEYSVAVVDEYGCTGYDTLTIESYIISVSDINDIDYGNTIVGTEVTKTVEFENTGLDSVYVTSINKMLGEQAFRINYNVSLPVWLKQGESIEIEIIFKPQVQGSYLDSVEIISAFPCNIFERFEVSGYSGSVYSNIRIPDTTGQIGDRFYKIPIYAKLDGTSPEKHVVSFRTEISFDARIFLPDENQPIITSNIIEGGMRKLTLSKSDVELSGSESRIAEINGTVLMSEGRFPINFNNFEWDTPYVYSQTQNGSLSATGVCKPDISEIILREAAEPKVFPNPARENLTILFECDSLYVESVELIDLYGFCHETNEIREVNSGHMNLDVSNIFSGVYMLAINTNKGIFYRTIAVVR